jgi:hypothetical protein
MVDLGKKKRRYAVGSDSCLSAFAKHLGYHYIESTIIFEKVCRTTIPSGMANVLRRDVAEHLKLTELSVDAFSKQFSRYQKKARHNRRAS